MKKLLPLLLLLTFSSTSFSQTEIKRFGAISGKATERKNIENQTSDVAIPYNTICFEEKDKAENFVLNRTNYNCTIKKFSSIADAELFAINFKNSDTNISNCTFIENKNGMFSFSFSVIEPRDTKWYLQLFQKNSLEFVKYNSNVKSINELLSK